MTHATLVSTAELAKHLADPGWVVVDCRHDLLSPDAGRLAYGQSHVPGARFMHLDRDLAGPRTGFNGRHPLPDPQALAATLGAAGIDAGKQVVAYDAQEGMNAARLWWMLRWLGHEAAAVLDGCWSRWLREARPVSAEVPPVLPTQFIARPDASWVDMQFILAHLGRRDVVLVDARSPERYRGEVEPIDPVAGRIPGSINRCYRDNLRRDGGFKSAEELRADFQALLENVPGAQLVHHCGSGISACHNLLAMEIAGIPAGRLYPGSWSEWCADPTRPTERG